jgi:hypothetical protein
MAERPFDVFLSYSSSDKQWAVKLKKALEAQGLAVWLDHDEIRPGDIFVGALERGIEQSRSVALVISPKALESGWVQEEYSRALALAKANDAQPIQLIPVILHDAKLPGFLANRNWVDFRDTHGVDSFAQAMQKLIWGITGSRRASAPARPIKRSALLDRRLVSELMMMMSGTSHADVYERRAAFLVSASCLYEHLFFENVYGSALHALLRRLDEHKRHILLALPSLEVNGDDTINVGEDAKNSWLHNASFMVALSRYEQLRGGLANPSEAVAYLDHSLRLAHRFDLALLPHPERWPLYNWVFANSSLSGETGFNEKVTISTTGPAPHLPLELPSVRIDGTNSNDRRVLPVPLTLHQYAPVAYPIPADVVPRYDPVFLSRLPMFRYEFVTYV